MLLMYLTHNQTIIWIERLCPKKYVEWPSVVIHAPKSTHPVNNHAFLYNSILSGRSLNTSINWEKIEKW